MPAHRGRALRQAAGELDGRVAGVLRRHVPAPRRGDDHLDGLALDALPERDAGRLSLSYSLINVSFPIEVWRQPHVPDSGAATMDATLEPAV